MCQPKFLPATPRAGGSPHSESGSKVSQPRPVLLAPSYAAIGFPPAWSLCPLFLSRTAWLPRCAVLTPRPPPASRPSSPLWFLQKRKAPPTSGPTAGTGTGTSNSRTRALTLEELQENFHLPINEVACKLGVCVTVLKQQCRELGIVRWPYRKVRKEGSGLLCT